MIMNLLHISSAVVWVDFFVIALSKVFPMTTALDTWYKQFGIVAVLSDTLVIILGILLAKIIRPNADVHALAVTSIIIQLIHDTLFYFGVILPIPRGHNSMIDLFKKYSGEGGYKILVADAAMIGGSVYLADYFSSLRTEYVVFAGLLAVYAITFILYTK
jgi:uncharacterized protein YacL